MAKFAAKVDKKARKYNSFFFLSGAILMGSLVKAYNDTNIFKVNKVQFRSKRMKSGSKFTILQVSDLHNKVFGARNEKLIAVVKESNADIIVLTGDLISRGTANFANVFALVEEIVKVNQNVFFVLGNHELENANLDVFLIGLSKRGVTILRNQSTQIRLGERAINLVGIDNASTNHEDLEGAFANENSNLYSILLSHSPSVVEKYDDIPTDLILSGHTHGGQIRLPFVGAVVGPDRGFFPVLDKGVFEIGKDKYLYIDSGLGTSGYPIRFMNQSQVSLIEVRGL